MPEKFDLSFVDENNEKVRPVVIHRAVFGSIDRFFGILIEHFAGAFPIWLAPIQVQIIPVADVHLEYALSVQSTLENAGIRVEIDNRNEKLGYKIRETQMQKVPYMLILGDEEISDDTVNVRRYGSQKSERLAIADFQVLIKEQIDQRSLQMPDMERSE